MKMIIISRIKHVVKKRNYFNKTFILIFLHLFSNLDNNLLFEGNNPNEPQQTKLDANNSQPLKYY